jgi:hypothetical protein
MNFSSFNDSFDDSFDGGGSRSTTSSAAGASGSWMSRGGSEGCETLVGHGMLCRGHAHTAVKAAKQTKMPK